MESTGSVQEAASDKDRRGLQILIVEDDSDCASSMALLMGLFGHQVEVARDGPAALILAGRQRPDVVLLDLGLPRMNGYEVARRLRALAQSPPPFLIVVSGYGQESDRRRSLEAGIDLHLIKPVAPDELEQVLRNLRDRILAGA